MYSQEEVDTADELSSGADDDAIQARVSEWLVSRDYKGDREGIPHIHPIP